MRADLSIIIPTYNRLWSLPKAVASCRQSECRTEIIVVDDGSTDGTWQWLEQQPDVVRLKQTNQGKTWAVNRGFEQAQGEYVRFLDSDDWCLPGANDSQLRVARESNADVVVSGYEVFSEAEVALETHPWVPCDDFIAQQLGECDSSHYSAYLFRRAFIQEIPHRPDFAFRDDRMFVLEASLKNPVVAVCGLPAFGHRHHRQERLQFPSGLRMAVTNHQHATIYRTVLAELERRGELTERRKKAAVNALWPLAHWTAYTHPEEAAAIADWVFQLDPEFRPPTPGVLGQFYRHLGFRRTEFMLRLRRVVKNYFFHATQRKFGLFPV